MGIKEESCYLQRQSSDEECIPIAATRVPPPQGSVLKGGEVNSKSRIIKAVTESVLWDQRNTEIDNVSRSSSATSGEFWGKKMGKFESFFYRILLVMLYISYGLFRYGQYQYNRMRLRILNLIYNPANTPQLIRQDVMKLQKIPKRLAAIVEMKPVGDLGGGLKGLLNDSSELVCWTVSAGIKHLVLYDFDGVLKKNVNELRNEIHSQLSKYYGPSNVPRYAIKIPHSNKIYFNDPNTDKENENNASGGDQEKTQEKKKVSIEISLLSNRDGRETIVDLTKTMADLCASNDLAISDISMQLIDSELTQLVGQEPDLLLYFGPSLDLQGFPPWHIRLTEFYWETDNNEVTYSVFIRGLNQYAGCKMNVGK
ncbi:ditrans,polycis-polyprenyl diphosphate synthase NDAI_0A02900 [Naumovozyma dairenensis CBS 421]|uniref:ditrans,polycis-polyprenyl diphosphate synthase [(2E,6E)-farnesyldiphosphate specific] n=1 Tax=Naumovozyma dairenensis (strain ATCC 10597 / BCRC 20456 / CBS 421 / NBRC 0211 / NRRL Y-12639) TaxID=1071378 RepID=G0W3Q9_NAUDC|nr:hypothetical protein NDAI_0A02900 [Naumovozyma dairenensis CBS 421]CCD22447.1 hypothetical protein NDAI_0A02900 [Naumovozyma dairenensis CBS 421]